MSNNVAVVNFTKCSPTSIVASNRIAKFIKRETNGDLIDERGKCRKKKYEHIFIVNGIYLYCGFREYLEAFLKHNEGAKFYWVANDYNSSMQPPPSVRKLIGNYMLVAAYENFREVPRFRYINWNKLTFEKLPHVEPKYEGLMYYGALRKGRQAYFDRYFDTPLYRLWMSAPSKKVREKFSELYPRLRFFETNGEDLLPKIGLFQSTIYIEDEKTHSVYCSPANRFYECLSAGTLMLFDKSCQNTFDRAKIDISDYVVSSPEDVLEKLTVGSDLREKQRKEMFEGKDYRNELKEEFGNFLEEMGIK